MKCRPILFAKLLNYYYELGSGVPINHGMGYCAYNIDA